MFLYESTYRAFYHLLSSVDSIAFNEDTTRLCVSSDKGTVHVFNLVPLEPSTSRPLSTASERLFGTGNRQSSFAFMKDILPKYFASEWSFASFQVPNETRCILRFPTAASGVLTGIRFECLLCADGGYFKVTFDPRAG
ncbi:Phosphatidylinositol 3,5-bisphosphate-binding protein, partial [Massospora cicadina]